MEEKARKLRELSEEIQGLRHRLAHFMNCEVSDSALAPLKASIQEKQNKLLDIIEEEKDSKKEREI